MLNKYGKTNYLPICFPASFSIIKLRRYAKSVTNNMHTHKGETYEKNVTLALVIFIFLSSRLFPQKASAPTTRQTLQRLMHMLY